LSREVGVSLLAYLSDAGYVWWFAIRMIKKNIVTDCHIIPHNIPSLVVPNTIPMGRPVGEKLFPWVYMRLTLH